MRQNVFTALWKNIAEKEIKRTIANQRKIKIKLRRNEEVFREDTHARYQSERCNYRKTIGMDEFDKLGRNEVAALFYFAFTEETNGNYAFKACEGSGIKLKDIVEITHCTALESVCDALNIVLEKGKENKILNQLINKIQKEKNLSIDGLAFNFKHLNR